LDDDLEDYNDYESVRIFETWIHEWWLVLWCRQDFDPAGFFSGLIDDVRIYNRTVTLLACVFLPYGAER
jgi:hypothetical protein